MHRPPTKAGLTRVSAELSKSHNGHRGQDASKDRAAASGKRAVLTGEIRIVQLYMWIDRDSVPVEVVGCGGS